MFKLEARAYVASVIRPEGYEGAPWARDSCNHDLCMASKECASEQRKGSWQVPTLVYSL